MGYCVRIDRTVGSVMQIKGERGKGRRCFVAGSRQSRPDTRPIPVADGWAGAEMRVFPLFNSMTPDGPTDGQSLI